MTTTDNPTLGSERPGGVLRYAAFTHDGAGGNPAGVVLDASKLDDAGRLAVAAQVGYSETAFVEAEPQEGRYRLRYFSPRAEVAFCGHATIAAAVAIAERRGAGKLLFETLAGPVPVLTEATPVGYVATLTSVPTRTRAAEAGELDAALAALRWQRSDLDPRYPAHVAYAGNDHLVLAVSDRARLAELDYDYDALAILMEDRGWTTVHLVYAHSPLLFSARDPFPPGGVIEDPATGAAAAAFGGYLRALALVDPPTQVTVLQGEDMGRPSRLLIQIAADDRRVQVTGTAAPIALTGSSGGDHRASG
ncbi:phenazine biosynthesis protein PhzF family [Blastococcus aurantiacus]|uniref:Phenazine biosynthesis protein PhzF family n=1 Tax=Blastococcus aurantiacus TaxID=1550231 RepID=A0A1G7R3D4_9ACTN|nr:PhzF family phenazine biosynthesis isomerase [Blastococcus aurantiacus]SDG05301.1 phenazine biosynthesis protein PhzF family [Blastococcus aurantiacus]